MGLGLAIVDRLCRLLDHQIELTSIVGEGSRFSVIVPSVAAQALTVEPKAPVQPAPGSIGGKLVVVIDDDALVLDSTGGLLRSWGCRCRHRRLRARGAGRALPLVTERPISSFPIIGCPTVRTASKRSKTLRTAFNFSIPAFLISGDTAPERVREARASGYHLLHKPVRPRALRAILGQFLKKHDQDLADAIL